MPRTKLHLILDLPTDPENPIQTINLTINATIHKKYGDIIKQFFPMSLISPVILSNNFKSSNGHKTCSLMFKVRPFRNATLYLPRPIEMGLNDMKSVQIQIQNRGSHIEQFGFRISGQGENLLVNPPAPITIYPGGIRQVELGMIPRPILYDRGTLHSIKIEIYPCDQPNVTLSSGILSVRTKGFVLSNVPTIEYFWHIFFAGLIIFFFVILILINRRRKLARICKKPEKPWRNYKERIHLDKLLKEKKNEEHEKTLKMMKEEYTSALLWYKSYRSFLFKERRRHGKLKKLTSSIIARSSGISKKTEAKKAKMPKAKEQKIEQKTTVAKPKEITRDDRMEKTLQKIRCQQQKQKKNLGI